MSLKQKVDRFLNRSTAMSSRPRTPQELAGMPVPVHNVIGAKVLCPQCEATRPAGYVQEFDIGWTAIGLQVWCRVHQRNVMHLNFCGMRLPSAISSVEELEAQQQPKVPSEATR